MRLRKLFTLTILLLSSFIATAQNAIEGIVVDANTNERLAFVNIVINDNGTLGTTTDIDGHFSINSKSRIENLTMSYIGYETRTIQVDNTKDSLYVRMLPTEFVLSEIIIDGRNNPAHRIIDSAVYYRQSNNIDNLDSYYYKMYDNMILTVDSLTLASDDELREELRNNDLMAMETVSEQYFMKPNKKHKNILANKMSGMKEPTFVYILDNMQSIGFQEDIITIASEKYLNPISKNSKNKYIFVLESSFKSETNDSIFTISFAPKRNMNIKGLRGSMTINSDNWAIQNIKAQPSKTFMGIQIEIQQLYKKVDGEHWFPVQLNTNLNTIIGDMNNADNIGFVGIGKSYITDIKINTEIDKKIFNNADFVISDKSANSDDIIAEYRYDTLSKERLESTYNFIDSIFDANNVSMDVLMGTLMSLQDGVLPISIFNLNLLNMFDYNNSDGFMLGLDLNTNNKLSRIFSIGGYGNYWFGSKKFNYGGDLTFNILPSKQMTLEIAAGHKFEKMGNYGFDENTSILNSNNFKNFYIESTSLNNYASATYSTYINKHIKTYAKFQIADKTHNDSITDRLSTVDLGLRIAFKEEFILSKNGLSTRGKPNPVIYLSYQKNIKNLFNSPYDFDKIQLQFSGWKEFRRLGKTSVTAQLGYINGDAPATDLFNIYASGINKFDLYAPGTFNTMLPEEFICDKFAALFFSHNFRSILFKHEYFHPEFIVVTNIAWGDHDNKQNIPHEGTLHKTLKDGFFESGLIIDKIIDLDGVNLGFGAFYRYGPNALPETYDNMMFKINIIYEL